MLKSSAGIKDANISLDSFERYFKAVNNHEDRFFRLMMMFYIL